MVLYLIRQFFKNKKTLIKNSIYFLQQAIKKKLLFIDQRLLNQ